MLRFIWRNWRRHKERLILLLIGALIISSGLSYLLSLSESSKGTIVDVLRKNWKAQYDILVRPPSVRSIAEHQNLIAPNYLSRLSGGITLKQWHQIENIKGVSAAAPLAMFGYSRFSVYFNKINPDLIKKNEIYRLVYTRTTHNGCSPRVETRIVYLTKDSTLVKKIKNVDHFGHFNSDDHLIHAGGYLLLAGIDPEQEAKLIGLDQAVLNQGKSRYFTNADQSKTIKVDFNPNDETPPQTHTKLPVLLSNHTYGDTTFHYTLKKLNLPDQSMKQIGTTIQKKGKEFLNQLKGETLKTYQIDSQNAYQSLIQHLTGISLSQGSSHPPVTIQFDKNLFYYPGKIEYHTVKSPFPKRWKYSYKVKPQINKPENLVQFQTKNLKYGYRKLQIFNDYKNPKAKIRRTSPYFVGVYDPTKLKISKNPLTKLPMQTYRPPTAKLVLDASGQPVNPPVEIKPNYYPTSFLQSPPTMLTTIQAAAQVLGDKPISSIRVNVKGVDTLNVESKQKLQSIAKEIEDQTGLVADITLGSSPQPVLIHVPSSGPIKELGWVQMPWVHLGTTFTIFHQTRLGFSGIIASVMLVAIAYVFATNLVSFLARRKEFAVLSAMGWRPSQLVKMVFSESLLVGLFVAVISWGIEAIYFSQHPDALSLLRVVIVGFLGLAIYLLGAIGPGILASRISPYEAIRTGEITKTARRAGKSKGLMGMSINHLFGKFGRNLLSVFAMVFPTMLLAFFLFVSVHLKGILYTTWLGQYAAFQVGKLHYIAMAIALIIAVLTTAEIIWQNVVERKTEIAILKAVGWRNGKVRLLIIFEGLWVGVISGILSVLLSYAIVFLMYRQIPVDTIGLIAATGIVPLVVAILGSILPAEIAVRVQPSLGMKKQR